MKKKANKLSLTVLVMAVSAMILSACGNGQQTFNDSVADTSIDKEQENMIAITENGVGPFMLGGSFLDISPKGSFYDTILLNRFYRVYEGDHLVEMTEKEMKEYKKTFGPYADIDGYYGTGAVMREGDTMLVVEYDEQAKIYRVEILSDLLKLSNGVHVGLNSTEMFKKYNARFLSTDFSMGEGCMCYDIPNLSNNITILANVEDRYYDVDFFNSGVVVADRAPDPVITSIPLDSVKNNYVKSIVVAHNYYKFFHNLTK